MFKSLLYIMLAVAAFSLSGCATGTSMYETPGAMSPPAPGMARIVVYRQGALGAAVQPVVKVDNADTGRCIPNGVFYVDVPAGEHFVSAETEVKRSVLVQVKPNEIAYVKCEIGFGFFVGQPKLTLVEASIGRGESASLPLTGNF